MGHLCVVSAAAIEKNGSMLNTYTTACSVGLVWQWFCVAYCRCVAVLSLQAQHGRQECAHQAGCADHHNGTGVG